MNNDEQQDTVTSETSANAQNIEAESQTPNDIAQADAVPACCDAPTDNGKQKVIMERIITIALVVAVVILALCLVLKWFVVCRINVNGASMEPNFYNDDTVWVNKTVTPKRGDVVVFFRNHVDNKFMSEFGSGDDVKTGGKYEKLIKRVVAVAGDSVWTEKSTNGCVLVVKTADGQVVREDYYKRLGKAAQFYTDFSGKATTGTPYMETPNAGNRLYGKTEQSPLVVSENCIFVLGDNRWNSSDSRVFGEVPLDNMYGVVINP